MAKSPTPSSRQEQAAKIAEHPFQYKVCEGCDSIVGSGVTLCPNCHSFRFDASPARVVHQAEELGGREQTSVTSADMH